MTVERIAPLFTAKLEDVRSHDGGEAKFKCKVDGHPEPVVSWFKDEEQIFHSEEFQISHEEGVCELFIPDVYVEDSGKYIVVAKNDLGTASMMANLFVERKSTFWKKKNCLVLY